MSSTTTNLGLVKMASGETIGQWSDANNGSGANLDKIDTAIGNLNSQMAKMAFLSWGTTLTATGFRIGSVMMGSDFPIQVWFASTTDVNVRVMPQNGQNPFLVSGSGSVTFSLTSATGTDYTITRSGTTITVTKNSSGSITIAMIYA